MMLYVLFQTSSVLTKQPCSVLAAALCVLYEIKNMNSAFCTSSFSISKFDIFWFGFFSQKLIILSNLTDKPGYGDRGTYSSQHKAGRFQ